jgi:hypothetical protein
MKITKRENDRWYDENNNSWDSEELATQLSPTLTDCNDCYRCRDCRDCGHCRGCINCSDCLSCDICVDCRNCRLCRYCYACYGCSWCNNCSNCLGLYNYRDKENLEPQVRILPPTSRIELDINDRKLEPDL